MTAPILTRPPRPVRIDPETHAWAAQMLGMPTAEISDVQQHKAGTIIFTTDGGSYIVVPPEAPDELGQSGILVYARPDWQPAYPLPMPTFADPDNPAAASTVSGSAWTCEDLWAEAERHAGPIGRQMFGEILASGDPRRLAGLWLQLARARGTTLQAVAAREPLAAQCRRTIIESGWLAPEEVEKLP